jgi:hypothetical protein
VTLEGPRLTYFLYGLALVLLLSPLAVWAIRFAKRQRGGAVLFTGLLLVFGMNMQITPSPPPQTELVQRQANDGEPKD